MELLSALIEIFIVSVSVAVFGGIALLIALETKIHRPAPINRNAASLPVDISVQQIDLRVVKPANAGNADNIPKAA